MLHGEMFARNVCLTHVCVLSVCSTTDILKYCASEFAKEDPGISTITSLKVFVFHALLAPLLVSYCRVVLTDPGSVDENWSTQAETEAPGGPWCKKCNKAKPDRSMHCPMCGKCVLKMDHHCPWVANCVGLYNYKFFYLVSTNGCSGQWLSKPMIDTVLLQFVLYGFLETLFVILTMSSGFDAAFGMQTGSQIDFNVMMSYVMSLALALSLFGFVAFHSYLILKNRFFLNLSFHRLLISSSLQINNRSRRDRAVQPVSFS